MVEGTNVNSILDIGCIPQITEELKTKFNSFTVGVNISKKVIKSKKKKDVRYIISDVREITLKHKFDLVFCGELIEHIFNVDEFAEKIKELLNDGGYLLLTTPNLSSLFNRVSILFGFQPYGLNPSKKTIFNPFIKYDYFSGHISVFTYHALISFIEKNGFYVLRLRGYNLGHKGENKIRSTLRKIISKVPSLAEGIIVLARKIS